ncbi:FUSC family protein [Luteibacter aegosomaticola]|uniref:FUSC family protein n=1 Tax=Luteibacter aegosomaticola TaxID=2911538 RepID=UPI001FFA86FF|nr:FUSC family protein [Luteibacter aegosomaticola]UPG88514.1 FUSC family protein [Luteibacter aegosomaticola]
MGHERSRIARMPIPTAGRSHFAEVFHWSRESRITGRRALIGVLGMAVPVAVGVWLGRPALGYVIGLGTMLLAGEQGDRGTGKHGSVLMSLVPVVLAIAVALGLSSLPFADVLMVALAMLAATLVNYSRPFAVAGIRFIVFLVLNLGIVGAHGPNGRGAALLFGVGAAWRVLLRTVARFTSRKAEAGDHVPSPATREPTPSQRRAHMKRVLRTLPGWQYPLRLAFGLAVACLMRDAWPAHHFDWMVLSIVLLTPRALEHFPVHITQRAVGTLAGVVVAGIIMACAPGHLAIAVLVCLFGAAAPLVRPGNYAAYCVLATPLILLAMDAGTGIAPTMLADRLVATLAGCAIVLGANGLMDCVLRWALQTE